jgi:hypothetical protein
MSEVTALLIVAVKHGLLITKKFQPKESWAYKWLKRKNFSGRAATKAMGKNNQDSAVNFINLLLKFIRKKAPNG